MSVEVPWTNILYLFFRKGEFVHNTYFYVLTPGIDVTLYWGPAEPDKVFLVIALTFGKPRDFYTGEVVYTDEVGFWHRGIGTKKHWDPLVESVVNMVHPHITPVTVESPLEIRFVNRSSRTIIIDISVWYLEYPRSDFEEFRSFIRGIVKYFRYIDSAIPG